MAKEMKCLDSQETVEAKREFVAAQTKEARKTGRVTIPVWIAFRCFYCGEYYNQAGAEEHFGMTREEFFAQVQRDGEHPLRDGEHPLSDEQLWGLPELPKEADQLKMSPREIDDRVLEQTYSNKLCSSDDRES